MRPILSARYLAIPIAFALATVSAAVAVRQSPEPGSESGKAPLVTNDPRFWHTATVLANGSVLVSGGMDGRSVLASAEMFDPVSLRFEPVGPMTIARSGHSATPLDDGRVLIAGGWGHEPIAAVEVYDPAKAEFTRAGRMREARSGHGAALLADGRVLLVGGVGKAGRPLASAEVFDPATGQSRPAGSMRVARMQPDLVRLADGRIAVLDGYDQTGSPRRVEVFVPRKHRFVRGAPLPEGSVGGAVAQLSDGRILSLGSDAVALLTPDARRSDLLDALPHVAGRATATLLDDGRVVVIGGDEGVPLVDIFDPASQSFSGAGSLTLSRAGHTASRLDDGTILVIGGMACMTIVEAAEIWDPRSGTVVAAGSEVDCDPSVTPTPEPLPPLGRVTQGGRIEMPASGFAITVPDDWTVELADPDTDVFTAAPGSAWEALRATAPDRSAACSVAVGVATVSLRKASGTGSGGVTAPAWHPSRRGMLMVPTPIVEESGTVHAISAPRERLHRDDPGLDHDALYSVHCVGDEDGRFERIADSLEFLPAP